jgi:cell division protein FtsN
MANKDFREIQVSSSLLVVIFLGVLALGVFIFLLGVSVGKRQVGAATPTEVVTQQIPEPVKEPPVKPTPSETAPDIMGTLTAAAPGGSQAAPAADNPAAKPDAKEAVADKPSAPAAKPPAEAKKAPVTAAAASGLYYVQVAAYTEKAQAQTAAEKYRKQGYTAVVSNPKPSDTKTWYRVRLGGYTSRDRAVSLLAKLNAAAGKKTDFRVVQD